MGAQGVEGMIVEKMRYMSFRGEDRGFGEALTIDGVGGQNEGMRCVRSLKIMRDNTDDKCKVKSGKWGEKITDEIIKGETRDGAFDTVLHTSRGTENVDNTTDEGDIGDSKDLRENLKALALNT